MSDSIKYKILEKEIRHFRELYDHDFKALDKALELKAGQDSLHFDNLNNEAARLLDVQTRSVSQEIFDAFQKSVNERVEKVDKWQTLVDGRKGVYAAMYALGVVLVVVFLNYLMRPAVDTKIDENKNKIDQLEQKFNDMQNIKK